jgi:undecaprenyl-diphosphatase
MTDFLFEIDKSIVFAINSAHNPFWDEVMWFVSSKVFWLFPLSMILFVAWKRLEVKTFWMFFLCGISLYAITDQVCLHLFKDLVLRQRPSYNPELSEVLHFYNNGGDYYKGKEFASFVSSHAANYFAIFSFLYFATEKNMNPLIWIVLAIGILICYSRMYLGVHYPSDLIGGAIVGILLAYLVEKYVFRKLSSPKSKV